MPPASNSRSRRGSICSCGRRVQNPGRIRNSGFTGNVALKISESLAEMLGAMIKEEMTRALRSKLGAALSVPAFTRFRKRVGGHAR